MDALGVDRAVLVGNSFGGALALRVAAVAPERVAALALISAPAPGVEPSSELEAAWEAEESAFERGDIAGAVAAVVDTWTLPDAPPALRDRIAAAQRRAFELAARADDLPPAEDPLEPDSSALSTLDVPALVAVGELDMADFHVGPKCSRGSCAGAARRAAEGGAPRAARAARRLPCADPRLPARERRRATGRFTSGLSSDQHGRQPGAGGEHAWPTAR